MSISGLNWSAVLHIATSVFDSGFFLPSTDPASCEKLSTILLSAVKFILKFKQSQRACELMQLVLDRAQYLLSTELVSVFAMGMRRFLLACLTSSIIPHLFRSLNHDACNFCMSLIKVRSSSKEPETHSEYEK